MKFLLILPRTPVTIGTTCTFFCCHRLLTSLRRSRYLSIFSFSFSLILKSPGTATSTIKHFISFLCKTTMSGRRASIILSHCLLKSHSNFMSSFFTKLSGSCSYYFTLHFNPFFLHKSQWSLLATLS